MSNDNKPKTNEEAPAAAVDGDPEAATPEETPFAEMQADFERFRDLAMRTQADFDNYRKRSLREKEDAIKYANASLLERLIPILDNYEFGLQAARGEGSQAVLIGFEMVSKQFQDFLAASGVEIIDSEGKPFDHNLHQALGEEESATVPEGHVARQLRKGYKLRDRLIRPANVFVSKGLPKSAE